MKSLIITAHPSTDGFTHPIAETYANERKENGSVEIINLYEKKWEQPFLSFQKKGEAPVTTTMKKIQKKITEADELVFVFPVWNMAEPAILKNFYDSNFVTGFAFDFEKGKPIPLLKGKTAKLIMTSSSPRFAWMFLGGGPVSTWKKARLGFSGIKTTSVTVLDNFEKRTEKDRKDFLKKIKELGQS